MKVKVLKEGGKAPTRAKDQDAGYDLYACEDVFIPTGETRKVSLGIAIELPEIDGVKGNPYFKVEDRSSLASKGIRTGAGIVDCGYRGELQVVLHNLNCELDTDPILFRRGYRVRAGDKIAQGIIQVALTSEPRVVDNLSETDRGAGGFGSTGR